MKRLIAGLFVAFGLSLPMVGFDAGPAGACSCADMGDADAFARADAVFTGTVIGHQPPAQPFSSTDPALWTFEVREVYKGEVDRTQQIVSEVSGASCGLEIPKRGEFLVFGSTRTTGRSPAPDAGQLYAGLCGGTRELGDRVLDPALARPHAPAGTAAPVPSAHPATPDESSSDARMAWIVGATVVAALGGLAALLLWRRARAHHT